MTSNIKKIPTLYSSIFFIVGFLFIYTSALALDPILVDEEQIDVGNVTVTIPNENTSTTVTTGSNNQPQGTIPYKTLSDIPGIGERQGDGSVVMIEPSSVSQYLKSLFNYFIGVALALTVVMVIYGGVIYATADAAGKKSDGKKIVEDAFWGLGLALASWLILYTINPDSVNLNVDIGKLQLQGATVGGQDEVRGITGGGTQTVTVGGGTNGPIQGCGGAVTNVNTQRGSSPVCSSLKQKIDQIQSLLPSGMSVRYTRTVGGSSQSRCHQPGNDLTGACADIQIIPVPGGGRPEYDSRAWEPICRAAAQVPGIHTLNEASNAPGCVQSVGRRVETRYGSGPHLHVKLTR